MHVQQLLQATRNTAKCPGIGIKQFRIDFRRPRSTRRSVLFRKVKSKSNLFQSEFIATDSWDWRYKTGTDDWSSQIKTGSKAYVQYCQMQLVKSISTCFKQQNKQNVQYKQNRWVDPGFGWMQNEHPDVSSSKTFLVLPLATSSRAYFSLFLKHAFSQIGSLFIWQSRYTFPSARRAALAACMTIGRLSNDGVAAGS